MSIQTAFSRRVRRCGQFGANLDRIPQHRGRERDGDMRGGCCSWRSNATERCAPGRSSARADLALQRRDAVGDIVVRARTTRLVDCSTSLQQTVGDPQSAQSPAALVGALQNALTQAAAAPQDPARSARRSIPRNRWRRAQQRQRRFRRRAAGRRGMTQAVATINSLLGAIRRRQRPDRVGAARAAPICPTPRTSATQFFRVSRGRSESETVAAPNGDTSIYTEAAFRLFQDGARKVDNECDTTFTAWRRRRRRLTSTASPSPARRRDADQSPARSRASRKFATSAAPAYQTQLDEIARGLGRRLRADGSDRLVGAGRTGVFTWSVVARAAGRTDSGLAGRSPSIRASILGRRRCDALRDGGIGGAPPAYAYNPAGRFLQGPLARSFRRARCVAILRSQSGHPGLLKRYRFLHEFGRLAGGARKDAGDSRRKPAPSPRRRRQP